MMLCLENLLKSNTCITAVEFSREDLDIWEQITQISEEAEAPVCVKGSVHVDRIPYSQSAAATKDFVFDFREVVIMRYM